MLPMDQRQIHQTAMFCHLAAYAGFFVPLGSLLGPLAIWLAKRKEDPFIDLHGREAVNFHLSLYLYTIAGAGLLFALGLLSFGGWAAMSGGAHEQAAGIGALAGMFGGVGLLILLGGVMMLLGIILPIVAALKADEGEPYRYPLTLRLL